MTNDFQKFLDKFYELAEDEDSDIMNIYQSSLERALNQFEKTDYDYAHFFNNYSNEEKAQFLVNLYSSYKIPDKYHDFIQNLNRTREIDYRNFSTKEDVNYNNLTKYVNKLLEIIKNPNTPNNIKINNIFIYDFLLFRDYHGNPTHWISSINLTDKQYHKCFPLEIMYIDYLLSYTQNKVPLIDEYSSEESPAFYPFDIFLELLNCTLDEIIYIINGYFDMNFLYFKDYKNLSKTINKLYEINKTYLNKYKAVHDNFYLGNAILTVLDSRNLRDHYFKSLSNLKKCLNYSDDIYGSKEHHNLYNDTFSNIDKKINFTKNINDADLIKYISECEIGIKGFNKHRKIIVDLDTALKELQNDHTIYSPNITIALDLNKLIDFKVLYHEIFTLKDEYSFKINSVKQTSTQKINLANLIKMIILTTNNKESFLNDDDLIKYGKDFNKLIFQKKDVNYSENEDSNLVYKINVLLAEKIRRGYYREFDLMENYKLIYNYKVDLRETLTQILSFPTINEMYIATICFYNDILEFINQISYNC